LDGRVTHFLYDKVLPFLVQNEHPTYLLSIYDVEDRSHVEYGNDTLKLDNFKTQFMFENSKLYKCMIMFC